MHAVDDMAIVESPREGREEEQLVASRVSVQGVSAVGQALDASVDCGGKSDMLVGQLPTQPNCAARTECAVQGVVAVCNKAAVVEGSAPNSGVLAPNRSRR